MTPEARREGEAAAPPVGARNAGRASANRIGAAALTGAIAKGLALVSQVVAIAVAVRALGTDGFATFVVISSLVSWISIVSLGVAPGLTLGMARSEGPVDRGELAGLFSVALGVMAAVAAVIVMIAVILAATGTFTSVADTLGATNPSDAAAALLCMVVLVAAQLVVVVPEGAQLGLQSQYVTNLWAGLGSAIAIGALIALGGQATTITAFILLAQLPQLVTRALNGIVFTSRRAYLLRPPAGSLRRHLPMLLGSGAAFTGFAVASYVGMQLGLLVLAVAADAGQVALAAVIVRGLQLQMSGLTILTTPSWPAITAAKARGDVAWIRRAHRLLLSVAMLYAGVLALAVLVALEPLIGVWTGTRPPDDLALRATVAVIILVNDFSHVNAITLVGLGVLRFTSLVLVLEACLTIIAQAILVPQGGAIAYFVALAGCLIGVSGWIFVRRVHLEWRRLRQARPAGMTAAFT